MERASLFAFVDIVFFMFLELHGRQWGYDASCVLAMVCFGALRFGSVRRLFKTDRQEQRFLGFHGRFHIRKFNIAGVRAYLMADADALNGRLSKSRRWAVPETTDAASTIRIPIFREFVFSFYQRLRRLKEVADENKMGIRVDSNRRFHRARVMPLL